MAFPPMKYSLFLIVAWLGCSVSFGQDWRYVKGQKLYESLDEALKQKDKVYNLSLYGRDVDSARLPLISTFRNLEYLS
ncbi:MAG: hypothetical protein JNM19_15965, partial [Chitinophagaceae bacterium]|nr:hypothetical protein [Chitinophagaceae bacterium]